MKLKLSPKSFLKLLSTSLLYSGSKGIFHEMLLKLTPDGIECSGNYLGSVISRSTFFKKYFELYDPEDTTEFLASTLLFEQLKNKFTDEDSIEITTRDDYINVEGLHEVFRLPMSKPGYFDTGIPFGYHDDVGFLPVGMAPKVQFLATASSLRLGGTSITFSCKPDSVTLISIDETVQSEWRKSLISLIDAPINGASSKLADMNVSFQAQYFDSLASMFDGACWVSIDDNAIVLSDANDTVAKSFAQARLLS